MSIQSSSIAVAYLFSIHLKKEFFLFCCSLCIIFLTIPFGGNVYAQFSTNCANSNFSQGNWNGWSPCWGNWYCTFNPMDTMHCCGVWQALTCVHPEFYPTGHKLIPAPGYLDPQTGFQLKNVYPGESYSARLGDSLTADFWESLKYVLTVSSDDYLLVYRYAVVLQDPGHTGCNQPGFFIAITDQNGAIIDSTCGYYEVFAKQGLPGWHTYGTGNNKVIWRDWTTVGMNLSQYVGQTVTIKFTSRDCSQAGHYGYAYFNAYCNALQVQVALCEGQDSATLTAPAGFEYLWSTGDTTYSITVPAVLYQEYWVKITSYNGCTDTIFSTITYTVIHTNFTHGAVPNRHGSA